MRRLAILCALAAGCGSAASPVPENKPMSPPPAAPQAEPERITVQHILISFAGAGTEAKRSKAEAEKLAGEVLARARKGEDFAALVRQLSDDPGEGVYRMFNTGAQERFEDEHPRKGMVAAFGDTGFRLEVGGIGLAPYEPESSPFGWHVIKRLK